MKIILGSTLKRPKHLGSEYASRFKYRSVAEAYVYRPEYSEEVYETLLSLIQDKPRTVLDVGCGPGKIALGLIGMVDRVDAVDFSEEMIRIGKQLPDGDSPNLNWICGKIEECQLYPPYTLITAGASIHWMNWRIVFPRFKKILTKNGLIAVVIGDRPRNAAWRTAEKKLILKYSTNRDYQPFNIIDELIEHGLFDKHGEKTTEPVMFEQSIEHYIESLHSRESLCRESMASDVIQAFDAEVRELLLGYSIEDTIRFEVNTHIIWGRPGRNVD